MNGKVAKMIHAFKGNRRDKRQWKTFSHQFRGLGKMITHRFESQPTQNGVELFHYYNDTKVSGLFFVTRNYRCGVRWNRPTGAWPLFSCTKKT